jgi:hypothetical protein
MSSEDEKSPITAIPSEAYSSVGARAIADATTITLGVMALAPLLECLMSHMGASSEGRRQALAQSNQNASLDLSNLTQAINLLHGQANAVPRDNGSRNAEAPRKPDLAVT